MAIDTRTRVGAADTASLAERFAGELIAPSTPRTRARAGSGTA